MKIKEFIKIKKRDIITWIFVSVALFSSLVAFGITTVISIMTF